MMLTLNKHCIAASIEDRYASIIYSFDFENTNKNGSNELKFEITIDSDAFISKFSANIDGELFIGKTKEKQTASKEYITAKEKNENAILISQPYDNIANVFEIKTNIDAKSKILLNITIEQYLKKKFNFNELHIQILRNFNKYNITQNYKNISFKMDIKDKSGIYDINIPSSSSSSYNTSYDIIINNQVMDKLNCDCSINGIINDKSSINELILKYKIKGEENDSYILFDDKTNIFCHIISDIITNSMINENDIDEGYNDNIKQNILIPRRVIFVIDKSGSMSGGKWKKTISATITALKQLRISYDRYGIICFNHDIEILPDKHMVLANDTNINKSISYLQHNKPECGTDINIALLKAIDLIKMDIKLLNGNDVDYNFFMNQIIFITDGEPNNGETDTNKIIENVKIENNLKDSKISIFSFGVGTDRNDSSWINDLNHSFLKILSLNNNGFYKRIKQSNTDTLLNEYFLLLSQPILSNIDIKYNNKNITDLTKTHFNTLYAGNDLIICGKTDNIDNDEKEMNLDLTISAITGKEIYENNKLITKPINICKEMKININIQNDDDDSNYNNIDRIWAYLKLQQLAEKKLLVFDDMIDIDDHEKEEHAKLPLSLALKYQFVTPWTSMIVVKHKKKHQYPTPRNINKNKNNYQRIQDQDMMDKMDEVQAEIDRTKDTVQRGIALAIDRGDRLEDLDDKASNLSNEASIFNKRAKRMRRHFCIQKWKTILCVMLIIMIIIMAIWLIADPPRL